jgi:hypothetical protein
MNSEEPYRRYIPKFWSFGLHRIVITVRLLANVFVFEIRRRLDQHEQARLSEEATTIGIEARLFQGVGHGLQSRVVVTRGYRVLRG